MRARLLVVAASAAALLAGGGSAALASTTGGTPYPTPTPSEHTSPPPVTRHHHPKPEVHCFLSLLTEVDSQHGQQQQGQQGQLQLGQLQQGQDHAQSGEIVVVQEARVCVDGRHVTATDISQPFAFEINGQGGLPAGLPSPVQGLLAK
jgi:hypothetical protein